MEFDDKKRHLTILDGKYFEKIEDGTSNTGRAIGICVLCKKMIIGSINSSSNFISHLRRCHEEKVAEYFAYIKQRRTIPNTSENFQKNHSSLTKKFSQLKLDEDVTKFIVHSMVPLRTVDDPYFKNIFSNFASEFGPVKIISRRTLTAKIHTLYEEIKHRLMFEFNEIKYFCTTADIWSGKKRSFLGVTCHWISPEFERRSAALACRRFINSHSYDRIAELLKDIHIEFGITDEKLMATVTDNGSNFIKAFKVFGVHKNTIEEIDKYTTIYEIENDEEDDGEEGFDSDSEKGDTIGTLNLPTHIRCFAHTLNLCATTDQNKIILNSKTMAHIHKKIIEKCNVLWKATSKPKTAEIVQRVLGKTLSKPGITRWNSLFDALKTIERSKDKYFILAEELNLCKSLILSQSDFIYLQEYLTCSQPIAEALDILQGEEYTFFGIAIPTLLSLRRKLEVLTQQQWSYSSDLAGGHLQSVMNRFKDYFEVSSVQSQNAAIASVSHPEFKNRWFKCIEDHHREKIMQLFKAAVAAHTLSRADNQSISNDPTTSGSKSKSYFDFGDEIDENISSTASSELEILRFFADKSATNLKSLECFPAIKSVFLEYNTPLPSSAPVERLFSWATITNQAKTNRLSDEHFEIRVVLKANAKFFDELC